MTGRWVEWSEGRRNVTDPNTTCNFLRFQLQNVKSCMLRRDRAAKTTRCAAAPPKAPTRAEAESQRGWRPDRRKDGPGGGCNSANLAPWPQRTRSNTLCHDPGEPETTPRSMTPAGTRQLVLQNGRPPETCSAEWTRSPSWRHLAVHSAIQVPLGRPKCSRKSHLRPVRQRGLL